MKAIKFAYCSKEKKACVRWVEKYFKDCLCNLGDEISFSFGLISLICWGIAEIPQIITNFKTKSGHGVSLAFLCTWVVGDVFNLVGCLLEPATLPTQYYTALLYTITTVALVLQCLYYDHICRWWNCQEIEVNMVKDDSKVPLKPKSFDPSLCTPYGPLEVPQRRDYYYTSARSLAGSDTPPSHSYLKIARSGPSTLDFSSYSSSEDDAVPVSYKESASQSHRIPRSVGYGTFLAAFVNLPLQSKALKEAYLELSGRRLLQDHGFHENVFGQWLGWMMAIIYMGGRIPQIYLNIKRGSVEGLNPLMFIFALIANITYVGSILARTTKWEKIEANMPWLLDAIVCVALDFFIIIQYIYYRSLMQKKIKRIEEYYEGCAEANKAVVS